MDGPHRRVRRAPGARLAGLVAALGLLVAVLTLPTASSAFSAATTNPASTLAADRLQPPSGLTATRSCTSRTIEFRAATRAAGSGSLVLPTPSGVSAGDLLVAQVTNWGGPVPLTPPAGWQSIRRDSAVRADGVVQVTSALYWRVAVAAEPASARFELASAVDMVGGIAAYSGVSATSPVDASGVATGATATTTVPSVTTTVANTRLVDFTTKRQEDLPAPGGTLERWRLISGNGTAIQGVSAGDVAFVGPGATPVRSSVSPSNFQAEWLAQTIALRPDPQGTTSVTLTWTATPSSWADGYQGQRIVGGTVQASHTVPSGTTTVTDAGLANGTTYTYRVWAHRGAWTSDVVSTSFTASC
jgi:hypothetical protein